MYPEQEKQEGPKKSVDIGNASNAGPHDQKYEPAAGENQLLDKKAEKYMRQVTSPEEMPDAEESQELDEHGSNSQT
jgi:hypothetical protein